MKTAPAGVVSYLSTLTGTTPPGFRCDLVTVTLLDTTVIRWCTADADLTVAGNVYAGNGIILGRGNRHDTSQLQVDGIELQLAGQAQISGVSVALRAVQGYFDDGRVQVDHLVGPDPATAISFGPIKALWEGRVAGIDPDAGIVRMQLASDLEQLSVEQLPKFVYGPNCSHAVYDANCALNKATFTLVGAASGVPTTTAIPTTSAALTVKPAGYFNLGVLSITSGTLSGSRRAVKAWDGTTFTPAIPFLSAPAAGDGLSVYPGCSRTKLDCAPVGSGGKFNNLVNFRGFVHIPISEGAN
jgi:uncharacterized phage protein (TIGR02218 family)